MATYAIGDLQGCYDPFRQLLDTLEFDPDFDKLWLVGDLVNRGPKSLKTLRFVKDLGDSAITVLGNHDLHLLALANDVVHFSKRFETLEKILNAPDRDELIDWLRHRPLAHYDEELDTLLVHAGVHPKWSVKKTLARAAEVEAVLQGPKYVDMLARMYGNTPRKWSGRLSGYRRYRFIINTLTRMRMLTSQMNLNFQHTGSPWRARPNLKPWFQFDDSGLGDTRVVFGHWSALGLVVLPNLVCLDTGCVWGRQLTAVRLDTDQPRVIQVPGQKDNL
ncbi:MAG: symmetrical bis(5'-nucleosyl)-tetraphosphatase [Woeseiaceae bacterium]|nr:symmetrical bis(5'-nucleosyl)-tetraphosphatase [Woeseiaceae bacterium]